MAAGGCRVELGLAARVAPRERPLETRPVTGDRVHTGRRDLRHASGRSWRPRAPARQRCGGRVAFTTGGWVSELYLLDSDGSRLRKLSNATTFVYEPLWSPDGRRIAFTSGYGAWGGEIAVIPVDADAQARFLTDNRLYDGEPAWSPDGRRIAFVRGKEEVCSLGCAPLERSTHEIYVMNADGTGVTRLTHNGVGEGSPAWQPPLR